MNENQKVSRNASRRKLGIANMDGEKENFIKQNKTN